jgi:hypothetical protein
MSNGGDPDIFFEVQIEYDVGKTPDRRLPQIPLVV